jgi:hypothetical protein
MYTEGYYKAGAEASRREGMQEYFDVKNRQRKQNYAAAASLLNIGSSLWDSYSSNKELIQVAEKYGFKTTTSKFTNWFGTPEFIDKNNMPITSSMLEAAIFYDDYGTSKNLMDVLPETEGE